MGDCQVPTPPPSRRMVAVHESAATPLTRKGMAGLVVGGRMPLFTWLTSSWSVTLLMARTRTRTACGAGQGIARSPQE